MPAFLDAADDLQPYESLRFSRAHATLQQPSAQVLENVSLREALKSIQTASSIRIWLDRRIDGEQVVQLKPAKRTHLECVKALCLQTHTEIAWLENILYVAPSLQAAKIETAYWKLFASRFSDAWQKKGHVLKWATASNIESILLQAMRSLPMKLEGLDQIEHDLWGPSTIPEASLAAQWTCLLSGFDRSLQLDTDKRWHVIATPDVADVEFTYSPQQLKATAKRLQEWRTNWPASQTTKLRNGSISVRAPVAAHRELMLAGNESKNHRQQVPPTLSDARYTLEFQGELGKLLEALAMQLELEFSPWPLPLDWSRRRVQIQVKDATLDELLAAVARQSQLTLVRLDQRVTIEASSK